MKRKNPSPENTWQRIEYWIKRNPDKTREECEEMMEARIRTGIDKRPDNSGTNNPNHRSNTTSKQRRSNSAMCIEFYEKKYPNATHEEHLEMLAEHKAKIKDILQDKTKQPKCVEHWTVQGYTEEEARQIISESQRTFSLGKCIAKYGEEEGKRIFEERQIKWQTSLHKSMQDHAIAQSSIAKQLIDDIKVAGYSDIEEEYHIGRYSFDCRYKNKLIEFNGDYWHCNPKFYDKTFYNKVNKKKAYQIWDRDAAKIKCATKYNYEVLTIWEYDYRIDPSGIISKCLEFLSDAHDIKEWKDQ